MVHFFDMEQTLAYGGLCYGEGGNYGKVGPTSKVTTPLAYIDDIINDLIQIFMVNKKSCGNLRMCVKAIFPSSLCSQNWYQMMCLKEISCRTQCKPMMVSLVCLLSNLANLSIGFNNQLKIKTRIGFVIYNKKYFIHHLLYSIIQRPVKRQ